MNIIEIGEKLEHVAYRLYLENIKIDEIAQITYLSIEAINSGWISNHGIYVKLATEKLKEIQVQILSSSYSIYNRGKI